MMLIASKISDAKTIYARLSLATVLLLSFYAAEANAQLNNTTNAIKQSWQQTPTYSARQFVVAGNAVKPSNKSQQATKAKPQITNGSASNYGRIPQSYRKQPTISDSGTHKEVTNRRPIGNQYDKLPVPTNGADGAEGNYGRIPKGSPYGKLPKTSDNTATKDIVNQRPSGKQYEKLPRLEQGGGASKEAMNAPTVNSTITTDKRLPPNIGVRSTPNKQTPKIYKTLNLSNRYKRLFTEAIIKPFKTIVSRVTHQHSSGMDPDNPDDFKPRPKPNSGILGDFIGGGANALVYKDPQNPNYVHKLVRIAGPDIDSISPKVVDLPDNINVINDQMVGREILNRFKQTHQSKLLGKVVEVADVTGEPQVLTVASRNGMHKFVHTVEQNISSPVYYKDAKGRFQRVLDENGNSVQATSAIDRIEIRAKNKKRLEALANGERLKLKEVKVTSDEIKSAITPNEELTINTVIRGLNKHGIVWTDHKMENFDVVADPKSPLGYKVKFFDFDGFRVVKGKASERSVKARKLQVDYDNNYSQAPADNDISTLNKLFDYTAGGVGFIEQASTPNANVFRKQYERYNQVDEVTFNQQLSQHTQGKVKNIWD